MFNNTNCFDFKNNLDNLISECQLPPVVAYYIIKDSLNNLQNLCRQILQYEKVHPEEEIQQQEIQLLSDEEIENLEKAAVLSKSLKADQQES